MKKTTTTGGRAVGGYLDSELKRKSEKVIWDTGKFFLWKGRNVSSFVLDKVILPQIALSFENILTNCRKKDKEGHDKFTHNRCDFFLNR